AIAKLAVEAGWVPAVSPVTTLRIDAPCGQLTAFAEVVDGKVQAVRFHCVPSFVVGFDREVTVPGFGKVGYDLAYGGAFYAYVDSDRLGIPLVPENYGRLISVGMDIKRAVAAADADIQHPFEPDLSFLYGTIFVGGPVTEGLDSRNVCIFADGEVDRCPTGSGVSGRMAIHHARGEIGVGEKMLIESITGSVFSGSVVKTVDYGPHKAVIPEVGGTAHVTGMHTFVLDPDDPFPEGFFLR
ncbi:MAG: proline racemase family protein, partial [Bacteroidota bacterium]